MKLILGNICHCPNVISFLLNDEIIIFGNDDVKLSFLDNKIIVSRNNNIKSSKRNDKAIVP